MGNETNKKGFGGLSDLKTDIDSILTETEVKSTQSSTSTPKEHTDATAQASSNERKVYQNPQQDNSGGTNPLWWWFIGGAILFVIIAANSNESSTVESAPVATEEIAPAEEAMPVDAAAVDAAAPAEEEYSSQEQFYAQPSIGHDNILSISEIRYCLANNIKITAIQEKIDETSNYQIDKINEMVEDHNARCGSYRYRESTYSTAVSQVEEERQNIIQTALNEFF